MMKIHSTINVAFLQKLYINLAIGDEYTLIQLQNIIDQKIPPSDFFHLLNATFDRLNSVDFAAVTEKEFLESKDNPTFELKYKILNFYSALNFEERQALFDHYSAQLEFNELEIPQFFNANEKKTPDFLMEYLFENSIMFFDEFDISDFFIDVESLLHTSKVYVSRLNIKLTDHLY